MCFGIGSMVSPEFLYGPYSFFQASSPSVGSSTELSYADTRFLDDKPYIHGTSSAIFALLPKTEQKLIPVWDLLQKGLAPLSGELVGGGMRDLMTDNPTRFGKIGTGVYGLQGVSSNYAKARKMNAETCIAWAESAFDRQQLTLALVFFTRARLLGLPPMPEQETRELVPLLDKSRRTISNTYYLMPFFARFVKGPVDPRQIGCTNQIVESILDVCEANKIDLKKFAFLPKLDIQDSSVRALQEALQQHRIQVGEVACAPTTLPSQNGFSMCLLSLDEATRTAEGILRGTRYEEPVTIDELQTKLQEHVAMLDKHFELLKAAFMNKGGFDLNLTPEENAFLDDPFGIILMTDRSDCFDPLQAEFEAKNPLALGQEIKMIAAPKEKMEAVRSYLARYNILGINVISIEAVQAYCNA